MFCSLGYARYDKGYIALMYDPRTGTAAILILAWLLMHIICARYRQSNKNVKKFYLYLYHAVPDIRLIDLVALDKIKLEIDLRTGLRHQA